MSLRHSRAWFLLFGLLVAAAAFPNAQGQTLAPGVPQERTIQPGEQHVYTLALGTGEAARLAFKTTVYLTVTLRQPGGRRLSSSTMRR